MAEIFPVGEPNYHISPPDRFTPMTAVLVLAFIKSPCICFSVTALCHSPPLPPFPLPQNPKIPGLA